MAQWHLLTTLHRTLSDNSRIYLSKQELCDKIECTPVTFDRLVRILREEFGAPLVNSRHYGGYKYDLKDGDTFELPGMWFKTGELEALICLEGISSSLQSGYLNEAFSSFRKRLQKLLTAQDIELKEWQKRFKILPVAYRKTDSEIFRTVVEGTLHRQKLKIFYRKLADKEPNERVISPQTVVRYKDNWYVDALCHNSDQLKSFSLSRIISAEILHSEVSDIPEEKLKSHFATSFGIFNGPATHTAEILFTGIAAREVSEEVWHPEQVGTWVTDDSYLLTIPYGDSRELIMDILKWGSGAEVVSPPELRNQIVQILEKSVKKYNKVR